MTVVETPTTSSSEAYLSNISSMQKEISAYIEAKKGHEEEKELNKYDHQAHTLKVVLDLLDPNCIADFYLSTEDMKVGDPRESTSLITNAYYFAGSRRTDGQTEEILSHRSLENSTLQKLDEAGLLWKQTNLNVREKIKNPSFTIEQRLMVAKILLENEIDLRQQVSGDESLLLETQHETILKALDLANKIDFNQAKETLQSAYQEKLDYIAGQIKSIDSDPSKKSTWYEIDGVNYLSEPREKVLVKIKDFIAETTPFALQSEVDLDKLTDNDLLSLSKVETAIKETLTEEYQKDKYDFKDPPLEDGTRVNAQLSKDGENWILVIDNVPSTKWITTKEKGNLAPNTRIENNVLSPLILTQESEEIGAFRSKITLPENFEVTKDGQYVVELGISTRKGHDWWTFVVLTPERLEQEKEAILEELRANNSIKEKAIYLDEKQGDCAVPVDEKGVPCDEENADHWCIYVTYKKWSKIFPKAFLLVPGAGIRTRRTAKTYEALVKEYNR